MEDMMDTIKQLTELVGAIEKKLMLLEKRGEKMSLDLGSMNSKVGDVSKRLQAAEKEIFEKKDEVIEKIDTIYSQVNELKTLVYEAGLVVVGPDRIEQLEKRLEEKKASAQKPAKKGKKK